MTGVAHEDDDDWDMAALRAKLSPKQGKKRAASQAKKEKLAKSGDGRSLRATGRTEHLNFRARPEIKRAIAQHVGKGQISLWLEEAIIAKLRSEGVEVVEGDDA